MSGARPGFRRQTRCNRSAYACDSSREDWSEPDCTGRCRKASGGLIAMCLDETCVHVADGSWCSGYGNAWHFGEPAMSCQRSGASRVHHDSIEFGQAGSPRDASAASISTSATMPSTGAIPLRPRISTRRKCRIIAASCTSQSRDPRLRIRETSAARYRICFRLEIRVKTAREFGHAAKLRQR